MLTLEDFTRFMGGGASENKFAIESSVIEALEASAQHISVESSLDIDPQDGLYTVFETGVRLQNSHGLFYAGMLEFEGEQGIFLAYFDDRFQPVKGLNGYALITPYELLIAGKFPNPLFNDPDYLTMCVTYYPLNPPQEYLPFATFIDDADKHLLSSLEEELSLDGKTVDDVNMSCAFESVEKACLLGYLLYSALQTQYEHIELE